MQGWSTHSASKNRQTETCRKDACPPSTGRHNSNLWRKCVALFSAFLSAHPASAQQSEFSTASQFGQEFQPCAGCPTFVKVPNAPTGLRRIEYVSKYPLTWREYLVSVEARACRPPSQIIYISGRSYSAEQYVRELKIDWPISILNQDEIDCFRRWMGNKTTHSVEIPSDKEWEWFALAGRTDSKFPWGNSTENPPAAVKGVEVDTKDVLTGIRDQAGVFLVRGVRVGLFPPNNWGLYDLIGNEFELTSSAFSGEEWYRLHPHPANSGAMMKYSVVLVKGGNAGLDLERIGSVYNSVALRVINGRFSANVSLRFVLVRGKFGE